uniref:Chitin-binding type-2 domain-containing protein n=1 Tax=Parasteatoda tepidariorum TaxID=114398 RepID=A0A2L2YCT4_PARTP
MQARCFPLIILIISLLVCSTADKKPSHKLVKRQVPPRPGGERTSFPLSRSRQFPPPEELEESEYEDISEDDEPGVPASSFRGRQPPPLYDYSDEQTVTEAPKITTATPPKSTSRPNIFNSRVNSRPKFGVQFSTKLSSTTAAPKTSTAASSNPRFRATPAQSQRLDVVADILNKPPPQRSSSRAISPSRTANENSNQKPTPKSPVASDQVSRRSESSGNSRIRMRARPRTRSTTTTTTTTTTQAVPEEYYYYYEDDDEASKNQPIATTTSTTTTTTTPRPSLPKRPSLSNRRPTADRNSRPTSRPVIKFDIESQFVPPPEKPVDVIKPSSNKPRPTSNRNSKPTSRSVVKFDPESQFQPPPEEVTDTEPSTSAPKRFTTSTTTEPPGGFGDIPIHLRNRYKPRTDGRFIDFLRDPNRPRELKGFDLTDYPFYVRVPEDIVFECDDKKDGYYASVPHKCQLFHYCFAGARYDFLCANYTLYDQTTFTCRFANNVDCLSSEKFYYRNDDLWKETTTTSAPETTTKKRRPRPRDYDYDDEYDYDEYDEEDEPGRRRRPSRRRRNRRKNKRKQQDEEEE